ncbi:hypothetical protein VTN49DRAFT_4800 [Thermomyces lanuginosus]|uniref:uncharacterized protein n=1 Tax=Thermomyces lanuginosus TaxID=5541 RepID=UPI003743C56C
MSPQAPKYVYKLVPSSSPIPEPLPEALPVSDLDQRSGFIHLSTALQVPNTLRHFFKDEPSVYVLRIEYERVEKDIRWEDPDAKVCGPRGGEGLFPEDVFLINHLFDSTSMERCFCLPDAMWRVQLYVVVPGFSPQAKETK